MRRLVLWLLIGVVAPGGAHAQTSPSTSAPDSRRREIMIAIQEALRHQGILAKDSEELITRLVAPSWSCAGPFTVTNTRWDPVLHSVEFRVRCAAAAGLPFLVRLDMAESQSLQEIFQRMHAATAPPVRRQNTFPNGLGQQRASGEILVRAGETVTLIWEEHGVRLRRRVICLDEGIRGQQVRTRIPKSSRIVKARAKESGVVEVIS